MKQLFRSKYIDISLIKGIVVGVAKADDDYALMIGFIVIEFKPYNMFRKSKPSKYEIKF